MPAVVLFALPVNGAVYRLIGLTAAAALPSAAKRADATLPSRWLGKTGQLHP